MTIISKLNAGSSIVSGCREKKQWRSIQSRMLVYKRLSSLFADKTTLYRIPEDLYVSTLNVGHAGIVNSKFLYQTEQSLLQIESLIRLNDSVGIFDKQTDQLLCWAISMDLTLSQASICLSTFVASICS